MTDPNIYRASRLIDALAAVGVPAYVAFGITSKTTELVIDLDTADSLVDRLDPARGGSQS